MKREELKILAVQGPTIEEIEVTPELAKTWLRLNIGNRPLRPHDIARYASDMEHGRWLACLDAIGFDTNGRLINGQHRLLALIRANVTIKFLVRRQLPPEMAHVIDHQITRTVRDSYSIYEEDKISIAESATFGRFILGMRTYALNQLPYTKYELSALFHKYREHIQTVDSLFHQTKRISRAPVRAVVLRAWVAVPDRQVRIQRFVEVLNTGLIIDEGESAAIRLRDYLLTDNKSKNTHEFLAVYLRTEAALQAFLENRPMAKLHRAQRELFRIEEDSLFE